MRYRRNFEKVAVGGEAFALAVEIGQAAGGAVGGLRRRSVGVYYISRTK